MLSSCFVWKRDLACVLVGSCLFVVCCFTYYLSSSLAGQVTLCCAQFQTRTVGGQKRNLDLEWEDAVGSPAQVLGMPWTLKNPANAHPTALSASFSLPLRHLISTSSAAPIISFFWCFLCAVSCYLEVVFWMCVVHSRPHSSDFRVL